MGYPPLNLVALFAGSAPQAPNLVMEGGPPFADHWSNPPFPLEGHLGEPGETITAEELEGAEAAGAVWHLRCDADVPPVARLPGCIEVIQRCFRAQAVAVILLAAHRVVGPSAFARLAPTLVTTSAWLALFLHLYREEHAEEAFCHSHGMEHFGLPDVEVWAPLADGALAERLVLGGIARLVEHGVDGLRVDDLGEAREEGGRPVVRFWVRAPREGHGYGAHHGARRIVPVAGAEVAASRPDLHIDV